MFTLAKECILKAGRQGFTPVSREDRRIGLKDIKTDNPVNTHLYK